jgi:hypothetical protein
MQVPGAHDGLSSWTTRAFLAATTNGLYFQNIQDNTKTSIPFHVFIIYTFVVILLKHTECYYKLLTRSRKISTVNAFPKFKFMTSAARVQLEVA